MPTLDLELKDFRALAHNAIASSQRKIELLAGAHDDDEHFEAARDLMLDIGAEQLTLYKLTVLAAKRADTAGEVAEILQEATVFLTALSVFGRIFYLRLPMPVPKRTPSRIITKKRPPGSKS